MSSFLRNIQRKYQRRADKYEGQPQQTRLVKGGYETCHPTRGWKRISFARYEAQRKLAMLLDNAPWHRSRKAVKPDVPASINRRTGKPHKREREMARRRAR